MKTRALISIIFLITFIASCTPRTVVPSFTVTAEPTATAAPTITLTPAPQSLADAPDLPTWVEEYVHAYGGKVIVNDVEMDAEQLTTAIRQNPDLYTEVKHINTNEFPFAVVNETPLAYKDNQGFWKEITIKKLGVFTDRNIGTQFIGDRMDDPVYMHAMVSEFDFITIDGQLNMEVLLPNGGEIQIINLILNGDDLSGVSEFFNWEASDQAVEYANSNGLKVQGHHIFVNWSSLTDAVKKGLRSGEISYDNYEKFLKVYVQTLVGHYNQQGLKIDEWTVTNEVSGALLWSDDQDILRELFINRHLMTKLCVWVKEVNPEIRTIVSEDHLFENQTSGLLHTFINLVSNSLAEGAPIDEIGIQNHLWIYSFPTEEEIDAALNRLDILGLPISSTEVTISISKTDFFSAGVGNRWDIDTDKLLLEQAKSYKLLFSKIQKNALFGFTDARSCFSDPNDDAYDPTAKALILDEEIKTKPAYYAILQVLYEQLP